MALSSCQHRKVIVTTQDTGCAAYSTSVCIPSLFHVKSMFAHTLNIYTSIHTSTNIFQSLISIGFALHVFLTSCKHLSEVLHLPLQLSISYSNAFSQTLCSIRCIRSHHFKVFRFTLSLVFSLTPSQQQDGQNRKRKDKAETFDTFISHTL